MTFNAERAIEKHVGRWVHLLGLGRWHITWEIVDQPIDHEIPVARNDYKVRRSGRRVSRLRFDRFHIKTDSQAERAVVHELLHLLDHGLGNDLHAFIARLEQPLRRARIRARR
jgi:hypothetical protein